jgi:hypothetical protein
VSDIHLSTPKLLVVPVDGDPWEIQSTFWDAAMFEETSRRNKWGTRSDNPLKMLGFLAWHAGRRDGLIGDKVRFWEDWYPTVMDIQDLSEKQRCPHCHRLINEDDDDDDQEDAPGSPTLPGPSPG